MRFVYNIPLHLALGKGFHLFICQVTDKSGMPHLDRFLNSMYLCLYVFMSIDYGKVDDK